MADGGQGFLKICGIFMPENYNPQFDRVVTTDEEESMEDDNGGEPVKSKRSLYKDGGTAAKTRKITGVNRMIMLCTVPEVAETYDNMKILFDLIQINRIPFKFIADFKLMLIVNGMQTASSSWPSPYCYVKLKTLRGLIDEESEDECEEDEEKANERDVVLDKLCKGQRTYGDLRRSHIK